MGGSNFGAGPASGSVGHIRGTLPHREDSGMRFRIRVLIYLRIPDVITG